MNNPFEASVKFEDQRFASRGGCQGGCHAIHAHPVLANYQLNFHVKRPCVTGGL